MTVLKIFNEVIDIIYKHINIFNICVDIVKFYATIQTNY